MTNQEQYEIIWDKANKYDKLIKALDKIRTEIEGKYRIILKDTPKDDWAVRWNDCLDEVLQIIDKYRESE
jgi:hypothetical protein